MVNRLTQDPPITRSPEAMPSPGGRIGGVEPVAPRPKRRRGPDWSLGLITLVFLGTAAALVYYGMAEKAGDLLGLGDTRTISARPETTIADPDTMQPLDQLSPGFSGVARSGEDDAAAGAAPLAGAAGTAGGYDMNQPTRQGGVIETRPEAHAAPTPAGPSIHEQRRLSVAPGKLIPPPGARPVQP